MKTFLKYTGLIVQLIGVLLLLVPKFMETTSNLTLALGGLFIALGIIVFVIVNKAIKE